MIADRVRVPPWALDDAPSWWVDRVRQAMSAEHGAEHERRVREERRRRRQAAAGGRR